MMTMSQSLLVVDGGRDHHVCLIQDWPLAWGHSSLSAIEQLMLQNYTQKEKVGFWLRLETWRYSGSPKLLFWTSQWKSSKVEIRVFNHVVCFQNKSDSSKTYTHIQFHENAPIRFWVMLINYKFTLRTRLLVEVIMVVGQQVALQQ